MGHDLTEQMRQSLEEILAHYDTNEGMLDAAWNSANGEASSLASAAQQVQGDINTEQNFLDARAVGIEENAFNKIEQLNDHGLAKEDAYRILQLEKKVEAMRGHEENAARAGTDLTENLVNHVDSVLASTAKEKVDLPQHKKYK